MKIKFLDTGEVVEVTRAEQLANTKVRVTPETSRQIQEAAFKLGYGWCGEEFTLQQLEAKHLFFKSILKYLIISFEDSDTAYFKRHRSREFQFLSESSTPEKGRRKTSRRMDKGSRNNAGGEQRGALF